MTIIPQSAPIPSEVRVTVLERDAYACQKCKREQGIDLHHKIRRRDGGSNDPDNLICLCQYCHREWHAFFDDQPFITFEHWLTAPGAMMLVFGWLCEYESDMLHEDWRRIIAEQTAIGIERGNKNNPAKRRKRKAVPQP